MTYEETTISTKPSSLAVRKSARNELDKLSTWYILWHVVKRHKFALLAIYAVIITVMWALPFLPGLLIGLIVHG